MITIERSHNIFRRYSLGLLAIGFLLGTFLLYINKNDQVDAANLSKFNPGNIISDSVFYNYNTMSASDIQSFLNGKVSSCNSDYTCLKNYSAATTSKPVDAYCNGYTASSSQTAAQMIHGVSQSCKVNPQVLLVLLQKETGLVTHTGPGSWRYDTATGFACPDSGSCDTQYYGLFNQLYSAARQYRIYQAKPSSYNYVAFRNNTILWHPTTSCGTSTVLIENQATAGLYNYTPYRPNQAALNAGYGTGDDCSSYGNRNFWLYFTDWFGDTQTGASKSLRSLSTDTLTPEAKMQPGDFIVSSNGLFVLIMQYSGQLILYKSSQPLWQSGVINWSQENAYFRFQNDGNLVLYTADNKAIWASDTNGKDGSRLLLQDDGNLVLYTADNKAIWASDTNTNTTITKYMGSQLTKGSKLNINEYLRSPDWRYFLAMQDNGVLSLYTAGQTQTLWASDTNGKSGKYVIMQNDGNVVIYSDTKALWASDTNGKGLGTLTLQNDGNLVLYSATSRVLWASDTNGENTSLMTKYEDCSIMGVVNAGNKLSTTQSLCSSNSLYKLIMQEDGNLVMYIQPTSATWKTDTSGKFFKSSMLLQ